ncbi:MAG: hypothetical protein P8Y16_02790, partial [Sulfurimonas sp.]
PSGLQEYMDGAKSLCNLGRGAGVVISFLQEMPLVAKECGEDDLVTYEQMKDVIKKKEQAPKGNVW